MVQAMSSVGLQDPCLTSSASAVAYRVANWPDYGAGWCGGVVSQSGSPREAVAAWHAPATGGAAVSRCIRRAPRPDAGNGQRYRQQETHGAG